MKNIYITFVTRKNDGLPLLEKEVFFYNKFHRKQEEKWTGGKDGKESAENNFLVWDSSLWSRAFKSLSGEMPGK